MHVDWNPAVAQGANLYSAIVRLEAEFPQFSPAHPGLGTRIRSAVSSAGGCPVQAASSLASTLSEAFFDWPRRGTRGEAKAQHYASWAAVLDEQLPRLLEREVAHRVVDRSAIVTYVPNDAWGRIYLMRVVTDALSAAQAITEAFVPAVPLHQLGQEGSEFTFAEPSLVLSSALYGAINRNVFLSALFLFSGVGDGMGREHFWNSLEVLLKTFNRFFSSGRHVRISESVTDSLIYDWFLASRSGQIERFAFERRGASVRLVLTAQGYEGMRGNLAWVATCLDQETPAIGCPIRFISAPVADLVADLSIRLLQQQLGRSS